MDWLALLWLLSVWSGVAIIGLVVYNLLRWWVSR